MTKTSIFFMIAFIILVLFQGVTSKSTSMQKLESGKIYFQVKSTPSSTPELFQFSYDSQVKSQLKLTQSSKIEVQAKLKFTSPLFLPQLIAFRLINNQNDRLTQPTQLAYDEQSQSFKGLIDFGDPETIKSFSDVYTLELMIADDKLENNIRHKVASCRVSFRYSIPQNQLPNNDTPISYALQSKIESAAPQTRIDPPQTFTTFILILMICYTVIFLYGSFAYLKINLSNFPTSGFGFLSNFGLVGLIIANFWFLMKFWLSWTFITTVGNLFWLILVTAFVANYALQHVKNHDQVISKL